MTYGMRCDMPITQADIAEATGLTAVHVNRTLQDMRSDGLIVLKDRVLEIPSLERLQRAVLFNSGYLQLDLGRDARARARPGCGAAETTRPRRSGRNRPS